MWLDGDSAVEPRDLLFDSLSGHIPPQPWRLDKAVTVEFLQRPSSLSSQLGLQLKVASYRWGNLPPSHCSAGLILLLIAQRFHVRIAVYRTVQTIPSRLHVAAYYTVS